MSASVLPTLVDALVAQLPALVPAGTNVHDGYPLTHDPADYIAVGVEDPGDPSRAAAGTSVGAYAHAAGRGMDEEGNVRLAVSTLDGGGDMKAARDNAFAIKAAVENLARNANPPLGLPGIWQAYVTDNTLYQDQTSDGAMVLLVFSVHFKARI